MTQPTAPPGGFHDEPATGGGFVPGPPVPNLPKADPNAPGAQPRPKLREGHIDEGGDRTVKPGNFNPNVRLDTSTTDVQSSYTQTSGAPADHYATGHQLGRALGAQVANQFLSEIAKLFGE